MRGMAETEPGTPSERARIGNTWEGGPRQPAVSLQVRALEKRLGTQLFDRSGRRVEPTEAGWRLYRGAQRLLALEEQVVEEVAADDEGELQGALGIGASTGP